MNKFKSFIVMLLFSIISINSFITIYAEEVENEFSFIPEVASTANNLEEGSKSVRAPNGIPITVTARTDGTGVDVYVGNVGVDGLDSVKVTVTATGHSTPKSQTAYVPSVVGKKFAFSMPMLKSNTTYKATILVTDGSGVRTLTGESTINYNETTLSSAMWNKGTFSTRAGSLDYHFNKHGAEVGATNIVSYLNKATTYRAEIVRDIASNNTSKYTMTTGTGSIASTKYKNKNDLRFAILTNSNKEILSFGK